MRLGGAKNRAKVGVEIWLEGIVMSVCVREGG